MSSGLSIFASRQIVRMSGCNKELCVTVAELRLILTMETTEGAIYVVESGRAKAKESNSDDVERMVHPDLT